MRLILLGTTGYHPNDRRHTACMMLPQAGVVLDAGTAMFRVRDHLITPTMDIFLTHAHLDHVVGLTFLFDVLYDKQMDYVRIHAEVDKIAAITRHVFSEDIFPAMVPADFVPLADTVCLPDGGVVTHFPLAHPGGSVGYRIDWPNHSLAYVTDTTADPGAPYVEAIRGVDVLLHEGYFTDEHVDWADKTGHSCVTQTVQVARAADVGRLILIHTNPLAVDDRAYRIDEMRAIFPATEMGVDNMVVEF